MIAPGRRSAHSHDPPYDPRPHPRQEPAQPARDRRADGARALALTAAAPAAADIQADDFNGTSLNTSVWTLREPGRRRERVASAAGRRTSRCPAGSMHDVWGNVNTSAGLRQAAPDRDFEIEAKFNSAVSSGYPDAGHRSSSRTPTTSCAPRSTTTAAARACSSRRCSTATRTSTTTRRCPTARRCTCASCAPATLAGPLLAGRLVVDDHRCLQPTRCGEQGRPAGRQQRRPVARLHRGGRLLPRGAARHDRARDQRASPRAPRKLDATVTWTTDESATSEVAYGPDDRLRQREGRQRRPRHEPQRGPARPRLRHDLPLPGRVEGRREQQRRRRTDRTLTTAACPVDMQSDEFNGASVDMNRWTLVDPVGGVTVERQRQPGADQPPGRHPARHLDRARTRSRGCSSRRRTTTSS